MRKSKMSLIIMVVFVISTFLAICVSAQTVEAATNKPYSNVQFEVKNAGDNNYVMEVTFTFPTSGYEVEYDDQVALAGMVNPDGSTSMSFRASVNEIIEPSGECLQVETKETITYTLGKLSKGKHLFILGFDDGTEIGNYTIEIDAYEKYLPTPDQVEIKVQPDTFSWSAGNHYKALVNLTFPDSGYRVDYEDALTTSTVENPDGSDYTSHVANANITKYTGPSLTVITTKTLEYDLGYLPFNSLQQFVFYVDGLKYYVQFISPKVLPVTGSTQTTSSIQAAESYTLEWVEYNPPMNDMEVKIVNDSEANYIAYVDIAVRNESGYRITTDGEVAVSAGVNPDGSTLKTLQALATVEMYDGRVTGTQTMKQAKFDLGKLSSGKYRFVLQVRHLILM